ncbi:MAG: DRTGG domain-containing protein [Chloroflexi bacterium]|nr:DRTGG domain-containing protein [Chloroflexota bacterium]
MRTLCLCSTGTAAGKTSLAVALGRQFLRQRLRVEYVQTVMGASDIQEPLASTQFVRRVLGLPPSGATPFPVSVTSVLQAQDGETSFLSDLVRFAEGSAQQCDVLIVEAGDTPPAGSLVGLDAPSIAKALGAYTLILSRYTGTEVIDAILSTKEMINQRVVGAVITGVPVSQRESVQHALRPHLERRGLRVLGIFPADRLLTAVTVGELARELGGTFIVGEELAEELVERLMIGAMNPEHAVSYFQRQANKAVITGGDRPDIQLAALETSTRCLILTGYFPPAPEVIERAKEKNVAIMSVPLDTLTAVEEAQDVFAHSRYRQERKVARFEELFNAHFDYALLERALGLKE